MNILTKVSNVEPLKAVFTEKNKARSSELVKKSSMLHPAENLGYIECQNMSSPKSIRSFRNSVRCNLPEGLQLIEKN